MAINEEVIRYKKYKTDASGNHSLVSQWTRSDTIEMTDGKTLEQALEGATGIVEITKAAYEALSEEEKNNGQIYHLTDEIETRITTDDIGYKGETLTNELNGLEEGLEGIADEIESQNEHLSTLDGKMQNFNSYENYTVVDSVNGNHRTRLQVASDSYQAYLFNHEENSDYWFGETISTYLDAPNNVDILAYVSNTDIFRWSTRKLVHGFNSVNSPLNNDDNDFYYDVIKSSNDWFKVIAYDVRSTNIYINEKINNVWQGWKPIRCDMITGTLSAGSTSITLTDSRITTDSVFRFFTSKFGVSPTACTVNNAAVILTFEKQTEPITVGVKLE